MEHINNVKSHAQTLCPCLIIVTCKNYWIFDLYNGQFWVSHLLPKKQQIPNKKFGQRQTYVSKKFIQEKIDVNIVMEGGNRIM